ncbi:ATPase, T2SS/T4P/T4SS family [Castellaniella sp.]|uniref:ATPase, T2SS/T4P/T4SS family n=1 Tax=Castellaniella sp. TaxID=1955812 RepID=UPI002AFED57E|nr:ATPase, T2SS/T4P/T4SS family [Castellaniella sp.]
MDRINDVIGAAALREKPTLERLTAYRDPFRFQVHEEFKGLMLEALAHKASDILVQPGEPVCAEVNGRMCAVSHRPLDENEVREILVWVAGRDTAWTDIISGKSANPRYEVFDPKERDERGDRVRYRYRINASAIAFHGQTSCQIVMRSIPRDPPNYSDLGLTEDLVRKACPRDGIVYVAGRTGSGKTTTFAAFIRYILENDTPIKGNFITHEEPIEFDFSSVKSAHSIIVQSQIPIHFASFQEANREAMRRKPGGIMYGELRDEESIRAAVEASQTGHPVFATVHANDVAAVIRRLISRFPQEERATAIFDIIDSVRLVMAQTLVPGTNGRRVAAREWLEFDDDIRDELLDLSDMGRVTSAIREMLQNRGWSFEKEADRLLEAGLITEEVAATIRRGRSKHTA